MRQVLSTQAVYGGGCCGKTYSEKLRLKVGQRLMMGTQKPGGP
jgi:hypothetical protein